MKGKEEKCIQRFSKVNSEEGEHLQGLGINGRLLKLILKQ
jgi:hypothetical protein